MTVEYMHCSYCGFESNDDIDVAIGGNYADGQTVICPQCSEETTDFDTDVSTGDTDDDEVVP